MAYDDTARTMLPPLVFDRRHSYTPSKSCRTFKHRVAFGQYSVSIRSPVNVEPRGDFIRRVKGRRETASIYRPHAQIDAIGTVGGNAGSKGGQLS